MAEANFEPEIAPEFYVIAAGLPRTGKSTGLNNIFDLSFEAKLSAEPVTKKISSVPLKRNGITLHVTDTPGLKAANANEDKTILKEMENVKRKNVLLILTLPVSVSSCITEDSQNIIKNLTTILGCQIWDWCLVLLTFSDDTHEKYFPSDQDHQGYQDYLKAHCTELQKVLAKAGVNKKVKLFFEYSFGQFTDGSLDGVLAMPVGRVPEFSTEKLFPLQPWTHDFKWTDLAFMEITKLKWGMQLMDLARKDRNMYEANLLRAHLIQFRHGCISLTNIAEAALYWGGKGAAWGKTTGDLVGSTVGTVVGTLVPEVGGTLGGELGNLLGPPVGAVAGALGVGGASAAVLIVIYITQQWEIKRIEQRIHELEHTK